MPAAVVNLNSTERHDLKSAPPDGYVVLRKMTYGQKLIRQQNALTINMEMQRQRSKSGTTKANMEMEALTSALFDFKTCVVEHNLTDDNGTPLNLATDFDVQRLDPRVGEEISTLIDQMNNFEEDEEQGNSGAASTSQS